MINEKKLNILLVHNYYKQRGGEDLVFESETNLLKKHGHNVITYTRSNDEISKSLFKKIFFPIILIFSFKTYFEVKRIIKDNNIEIVHVHNNLFFVSQSIYYAAKSMKVPVVQSIHNFRLVCPNALLYCKNKICEKCINDGFSSSIKNKCYKDSRIITALMVLNLIIHQKTKIHKYVNFICNSNFTSSKIQHDKTISKDKIFIKSNFTILDNDVKVNNDREDAFVYAARLDENKGIKFLLESWKVYNNPQYKLYICGSGELKNWCEKFIIDNNLKNVEMLGYLSHERMLDLFSRCRALIYPTKWYEAMPIAIIDAFSVGTPVIGPNIGNVGEMIVDGLNGYKYESDSTSSFINAMNEVSKLVTN